MQGGLTPFRQRRSIQATKEDAKAPMRTVMSAHAAVPSTCYAQQCKTVMRESVSVWQRFEERCWYGSDTSRRGARVTGMQTAVLGSAVMRSNIAIQAPVTSKHVGGLERGWKKQVNAPRKEERKGGGGKEGVSDNNSEGGIEGGERGRGMVGGRERGGRGGAGAY
jgi:hypothetical protein